MKLIPISAAIFFAILALVLIVGLFPTPPVIGIGILLSTFLVLFQAYIILKDKAPEKMEGYGPE